MQEARCLFGMSKKPDQIDGIARKHFGVGNVETLVVDAEIRLLPHFAPFFPRQRHQEAGNARRGLELLHFQSAAQNSCQVADILGNEKIVLHEPLDGLHAPA